MWDIRVHPRSVDSSGGMVHTKIECFSQREPQDSRSDLAAHFNRTLLRHRHFRLFNALPSPARWEISVGLLRGDLGRNRREDAGGTHSVRDHSSGSESFSRLGYSLRTQNSLWRRESPSPSSRSSLCCESLPPRPFQKNARGTLKGKQLDE